MPTSDFGSGVLDPETGSIAKDNDEHVDTDGEVLRNMVRAAHRARGYIYDIDDSSMHDRGIESKPISRTVSILC